MLLLLYFLIIIDIIQALQEQKKQWYSRKHTVPIVAQKQQYFKSELWPYKMILSGYIVDNK